MTETFRAQMDAEGSIEYSRGIARQYGIEAGDSIRVELVEVSAGDGRTQCRPGEVFLVDLDSTRPTVFALPGELREQYDITDDHVVRLRIHQIIKDGRTSTLGDASLVTPPEGEPVFSQVAERDRRVSFAGGLARLHDIERGDSVRVTLTEVTMPWGETVHEDLAETFVADLLEHDRTAFTIPDGVCEEYKIREGGFVRFRLHAVITDGEVHPITDGVRAPDDDGFTTDVDVISTREESTPDPATRGRPEESVEPSVAEYTDRRVADARDRAQSAADRGESPAARGREQSPTDGRSATDAPQQPNANGGREPSPADYQQAPDPSTREEPAPGGNGQGRAGDARGRAGTRRDDRQEFSTDEWDGQGGSGPQRRGDAAVERSDNGHREAEAVQQRFDTREESGPGTTRHPAAATQPSQEAVEEYVPGHDTRELLEAIVADAFDSLEYAVDTNVRKATGDGNAVKEIDIWAEKPGVTFSAYASCKNHENEVGTPVIDREAGRVNALQQSPHLKVIVAPSFNDNARQALDNRGFVGIETGEQAVMDNAGAVYDRVRTQLADLSLSLAPPRIQDLAERVDEVSAELSSLSGELRELEDGPGRGR